MKSIFNILFFVVFLFSCSERKVELELVNDVCKCYNKVEFTDLDETLNICIDESRAKLNKKSLDNNEIIEFEDAQLYELIKSLIKSCPRYQKDFNSVLLSKYSNRNKVNIEERIDSLLHKIDSENNKAPVYIQLAELEIINSDFEKAMESINTTIELNPNMEMSYFIRGFLFHRVGDITNAISDIKTMRNITKQSDLKFIAECWILNLEQEIK